MRLTDLFEVSYIQRIQNTFAGATKVTTVIVDDEGAMVTAPSNWTHFCKLFSREGDSEEVCRQNIQAMVAENLKTGNTCIAQCPHTGLGTAAVPLFLDGEYLGSWLFGQMTMCEADGDALANAGIGKADAAAMLGELPDMTKEEFVRIQAFLETLSGLVLRLGAGARNMREKNAELTALSEKLAASGNALRHFLDAAAVAMFVCDCQSGEILLANESFCHLAGLTMPRVVGRMCNDIMGIDEHGLCTPCTEEEGAQEETWSYFNLQFNMWLRCTRRQFTWVDGRRVQLVTQADITEEHEMQQALLRAAYCDRNTGLPNAEKLELDLAGAERPLARDEQFLVCFNLQTMDAFHSVYGRSAGIQLLRTITAWAQGCNFEYSTLYRAEGYTFCLLLEHSGRGPAENIARYIARRFAQPWMLCIDGQEVSYFCTANFSLVCLSDNTQPGDILDLVDRTLLHAGKTGELFVHDVLTDEKTRQHMHLQMLLKNCIRNGMQGFDVHYQPIVDAATGVWKGLEALCRWDCPDRGDISPAVFIPETEQLGLVGTLGNWVLETAVAQCKRHRLDELSGFFLAVNISPLQMMDGQFATRVLAVLKQHAFAGEKLCLEVTESVEMEFDSFTISVIAQLRAAGIKLALDDFGTGYSSFNNLKHIPADYLKTERSFILDIEEDPTLQYYYYVMGEMAHANGKAMIAEGVETAQQLEVVHACGADFVQGYYFSRPLAAAQLPAQFARFTKADETLVRREPGKLDINRWLSGRSAYVTTPRMFRILNQCMELLLSDRPFEEALQEVLKTVGSQLHVRRAVACVHVEGTHYRRLAQWCAEEMAEGGTAATSGDAEGLVALLRSDGMLVAPDITKLPPELYDLLYPTGAAAAVVMPVWDKTHLAGFIGFDDASLREWTAAEVLQLWYVCLLLAGNVKTMALQRKGEERLQFMREVLNHSGLQVFVSDPETDKVLWANEALKNHLGAKRVPQGSKCYKAVRGLTKRCPHCKKDELMAKPDLPLAQEYHDEKWDRTLLLQHSTIAWEGGKTVHVEYCMDITEYTKLQKQLARTQALDFATGVLNRTATLQAATELLHRANSEGRRLCVAVVEVPEQKQLGQKFWYATCDGVLQCVAAAINENIRCTDVAGRIADNEMVVLFPSCTRMLAEKHLVQAQSLLAKVLLPNQERAIHFRYGLAENIEIPYRTGDTYFQELFALAKKRMHWFSTRSESSVIEYEKVRFGTLEENQP